MKSFFYINTCLLLICIGTVSFFGWVFAHPTELPMFTLPPLKEYNSKQKKWVIPKRTLAAYPKSPLTLKTTPYTLSLPDLRNELIYYGKNMRPDATFGKTCYFLGLEGEGPITTIEEGAPLYLKYQGHPSDGQSAPYIFSPNNEPTALWIELQAFGTQAEIRVSLMDENHKKISCSSDELACFRIPSRPLPSSQEWFLGKQRVDPTLLVRQKARFVGEDLFLQMHGGDEYALLEGSYRLDFLEGDEPYSCFVKPGDFLVWEQEQWRSSNETTGKPLLMIQSIDDRIMHCELWDPLGSKKMHVTLLRLKDHYGIPDMSTDFHFVQAKTWSQFIVECRGKKMTLRPGDWLLLTEEGWEKIDTVEKLEAYVEQTLTGPLLVIEKLKKEEGGQFLSAHLFNATRSMCTEVALEQKKITPAPVVHAVRSLTQKTIHNEASPHSQTAR